MLRELFGVMAPRLAPQYHLVAGAFDMKVMHATMRRRMNFQPDVLQQLLMELPEHGVPSSTRFPCHLWAKRLVIEPSVEHKTGLGKFAGTMT
jgi:hypothetical protein